ncbi:MAG: type IV conjugative transfer system protein TraL [Waddliaceae bacterium]
MSKNLIYKTLDNSPRVLFWTIDEFAVLAVPVFLGVLMGSLLVMSLGLVLRAIYTKLKKRCPKGTLMHRLYWRLPQKAFNRAGILKRIPGSHHRKFLL